MPTPLTNEDLAGMQLTHNYVNGREYELYVKNEDTIDFRIFSGMEKGLLGGGP
jgi:phenolic acid decarboxylase